MWDGVASLGPWQGRDEVIYEGRRPVTAVILNAGPWPVRLRAWAEWIRTAKTGDQAPQHDLEMKMAPGSTRAISGTLITVGIDSPPPPPSSPWYPTPPASAVAWRLLA